jgi:type II secretory pathway pseudopilin PulG
MVISARRSKTKGGPGFTLVELVLVVALLLGLLGALVYNFGPMQRGANLDEGAKQFEALVRFAGAHAASTGRAVQFRFELDCSLPSRGSRPSFCGRCSRD